MNKIFIYDNFYLKFTIYRSSSAKARNTKTLIKISIPIRTFLEDDLDISMVVDRSVYVITIQR